jgi:hypothetical protein
MSPQHENVSSVARSAHQRLAPEALHQLIRRAIAMLDMPA